VTVLDALSDRFADLIAESCDRGRILHDLPSPGISSVADAYAVQDRIFARMTKPGAVAAGWFASATNASMRVQLGLEEPYAARWRPGRIVEAPVEPLSVGPLGLGLELEVCFELAADLPPRSAPYGEPEVLAAVAAVRPGIEMVVSCFADWMTQKPLNLVAEGGPEQLLVIGPAVTRWSSLPLDALPVTLTVDGQEAAVGSSGQVMAGPASVLVWLANHAARRGEGLRRGQVCNTGMCAPVFFASPGQRVQADFGPLGRVDLDLAAESGAPTRTAEPANMEEDR
jgi:2-keto-4-pentenoate hydratase